jgi:hypothetical protein
MDRLMSTRLTNTAEFRTNRDRPLGDFDWLPAPVRRAFADSPYDFAFGDILAQIQRHERELNRALTGAEIDFVVGAMASEARTQVEVSAYAFYGEDHPQARVVSNGTLHKYGLLSIRIELALWRAGLSKKARRR